MNFFSNCVNCVPFNKVAASFPYANKNNLIFPAIRESVVKSKDFDVTYVLTFCKSDANMSVINCATNVS